jgi:hypothetical protein
MELPRPAVVVALLTPCDEEAERAQAEMAAHEERLRAAGAIPALKRAVAGRLADRGATYPTAVRGPLAPPVPAAAAR